MHIVKEYNVELSTYHDEIVGRIQYVNKDDLPEESNLYSLPELNNIVQLWQMGELMGSFGIGSILADNARVNFFSRG